MIANACMRCIFVTLRIVFHTPCGCLYTPYGCLYTLCRCMWCPVFMCCHLCVVCSVVVFCVLLGCCLSLTDYTVCTLCSLNPGLSGMLPGKCIGHIMLQPFRAMSHETICPCNLQCKFCRKEYCRLQLGCQTYATCFATCNEMIFYARRVFKNVSGILIMSYCDWFLLKKLRDKLQWGCHTRCEK